MEQGRFFVVLFLERAAKIIDRYPLNGLSSEDAGR